MRYVFCVIYPIYFFCKSQTTQGKTQGQEFLETVNILKEIPSLNY